MGKIYYCPSAFQGPCKTPAGEVFEKLFKEAGIHYTMDNNFALYKGGKIDGHRIIRDSGGLQLGRGVKESIDVKKFYTQAEKEKIFGVMTVDFPLIFSYNETDLIKHAQFQRIQTNKIKKYLSSKRLYNIIHGRKYDEYIKYHNIVYDKDLDKISFGDCITNDPNCYVSSFMKFFDKWHKQYKFVHILGGYSITRNVGPLTWLVHHRYKDMTITFDNTTDHQVSKRMRIVDRKSGKFSKDITKQFLQSCNCKLCKKYKDKYNKDYTYYHLHNVYTSLEVFKELDKDAQTLSLHEYCKKWKLSRIMEDILSGNYSRYVNKSNFGFMLRKKKDYFFNVDKELKNHNIKVVNK